MAIRAEGIHGDRRGIADDDLLNQTAGQRLQEDPAPIVTRCQDKAGQGWVAAEKGEFIGLCGRSPAQARTMVASVMEATTLDVWSKIIHTPETVDRLS